MGGWDPFRTLVREQGARLYRDLPWRRTRDPYAIWVSEVMLQQTQVPRVEGRWQAWLERFPSVGALAAASRAEVLEAWQGLGYNRRALALKAAAEQLVADRDGELPQDTVALQALPGVGPATAQGIRAFAFDLPGVYLETNVRTVFLHHCFPDAEGVPDKELVPLVEATCPMEATRPMGPVAASPYAVPFDADDTPRSWYFALLDYGAHLKRTLPNPSRRSSGYARQGTFEGSRRQKRAEVVRILLGAGTEDGIRGQAGAGGLSVEDVAGALDAAERASGRAEVGVELTASILTELGREGFCVEEAGRWRIA